MAGDSSHSKLSEWTKKRPQVARPDPDEAETLVWRTELSRLPATRQRLVETASSVGVVECYKLSPGAGRDAAE